MSENKIQYNEACPECEAAGVKNLLYLDCDLVQIQCDSGHTFEELPSDQALRTGKQEAPKPLQIETSNPLQTASVLEVPAPSSEKVEANTLEKVKEPRPMADIVADLGSKLAQENREIAEQYGIDLAKMAPLDSGVEVSGASGFGLPRAVELRRPEIGTRQILVAEGQAVTLENGDVLFGLKVPEAWVQAVQSEADNQLRSPASYLSSWLVSEEMRAYIVDGLITYWSSSYSQTK